MGAFEYEVLAAIARLGSRAYGVPIREEIMKVRGGTVSIGALYTTLNRLEDKGYVSSRLGDPTPERGGRAKRFFRVEAPGVEAMHEYERRARAFMQPTAVAAGVA